MGRRGKGHQSRLQTNIRVKVLNNLVYIYDESAGLLHSSELNQELKRRRDEDKTRKLPYCPIEECDLIVGYLNSDDVMKVLGCNRRTALDYLETLRIIVGRFANQPE